MRKASILTVLIVAVAFMPASATIINVPDDYPTIQEGIDASSDGDTVLVQPDTYVENINFNGHNIVLGSLFLTIGDTSYISTTIIDGDSSGSVVTFENGEDSTAIITGFTIQNGYAEYGGGIYCHNSNPLICNNTISLNWATTISEGRGFGGGIYCNNSHPLIIDNTIIGNTAMGRGYVGFGGGIYCEDSSPTISKNIINGNEVAGSSGVSGGGIYCINSHPAVSNNIISENRTGLGAGICLNGSNPTVVNNTFNMNSAQDGGGITCYLSSPIIINNIISGNTARSIYYGWGGGIFCIMRSNPIIINNIIIGNSADSRGGGIYCWDSNPIITNTIFWADTASEAGNEIYIDDSSLPLITYCDIQGGWEGEGNIDCDPWFCYPDTGNFYLAENSCCVGAGCDSLGNPDSTINIGAFGIGCGEHTDISGELYTLPIRFSISQNYPNPFNAKTSISFELKELSPVLLEVFDIRGAKVTTLVDEFMQTGSHSVTWDAENLASGVYYYRLKAGNFSQTKRAVFIK